MMPTEESKAGKEGLAAMNPAGGRAGTPNELATPSTPSTVGAALSVSVPRETVAGEQRVALVPELVPRLIQAGLEVHVQAGAGAAAGFPDSAYQEQGAHLEPDRIGHADIVLRVQPPIL